MDYTSLNPSILSVLALIIAILLISVLIIALRAIIRSSMKKDFDKLSGEVYGNKEMPSLQERITSDMNSSIQEADAQTRAEFTSQIQAARANSEQSINSLNESISGKMAEMDNATRQSMDNLSAENEQLRSQLGEVKEQANQYLENQGKLYRALQNVAGAFVSNFRLAEDTAIEAPETVIEAITEPEKTYPDGFAPETIRKKLKSIPVADNKARDIKETRKELVEPFLEYFGWSIPKDAEDEENAVDSNWTRAGANYILYVPESGECEGKKENILVYVRKYQDELVTSENLKELNRYCNEHGSKVSILTDGVRYLFFTYARDFNYDIIIDFKECYEFNLGNTQLIHDGTSDRNNNLLADYFTYGQFENNPDNLDNLIFAIREKAKPFKPESNIDTADEPQY